MCFAIVLGAEILRFVRTAQSIGVASTVEIVVVTLALFLLGAAILIAASRHRDARRLTAVQNLTSPALVVQAFAGANLIDAVEFLRGYGGVSGKLPMNAVVTVSIDRSTLSFYSGGGHPRLRMKVGWSRVSASPGVCRTVRGPYPCVNLVVKHGSTTRILPLLTQRTTVFGAREKSAISVASLSRAINSAIP
jgi:hypothetical protein